MAIPKFPDPKDPDDVADYTFSFAEAMVDGDTIASIDLVHVAPSNPSPPPPSNAPDVSVVASVFSGQTATLWLQGGKAKWRYEISLLLRTTGGRTFRRRALLTVQLL